MFSQAIILAEEENREWCLTTKGEFKEAGVGATMFKGQFKIPPQYHMHMETQTCICVPIEDGIEVYSSTQMMDNVQIAVATALGIPNNQLIKKNTFIKKNLLLKIIQLA